MQADSDTVASNLYPSRVISFGPRVCGLSYGNASDCVRAPVCVLQGKVKEPKIYATLHLRSVEEPCGECPLGSKRIKSGTKRQSATIHNLPWEGDRRR